MAFDGFCEIDQIAGESSDEGHENQIEILDYEHDVAQPPGGEISTAGGLVGQRADHGYFKIRKHLDLASPKLALFCCNGTPINVTISLNRAGGDKQEYMVYKLSDAIIQKLEVQGEASEEHPLPREHVWFRYSKIEWTYTQQSRSDGTGGGVVEAFWDCGKNVGG